MTIKNLEKLLQQGEGLKVEFKTSLFELSKNTFETVCAFLNRKGGHLLLGVKDGGTIEGVIEDGIQNIIDNACTNCPKDSFREKGKN
jgi:ATP-dependent DNA helicase RecG